MARPIRNQFPIKQITKISRWAKHGLNVGFFSFLEKPKNRIFNFHTLHLAFFCSSYFVLSRILLKFEPSLKF